MVHKSSNLVLPRAFLVHRYLFCNATKASKVATQNRKKFTSPHFFLPLFKSEKRVPAARKMHCANAADRRKKSRRPRETIFFLLRQAEGVAF
jgi:hypothetical protein